MTHLDHPYIFITGTDTDAGKTVCSAWLCLHLQRDYWKPFQTGVDSCAADADTVQNLLGSDGPSHVFPSAVILQAPASPADAARKEGRAIDLETITMPQSPRGIIIEGAGGAMVPLTPEELLCDWVAEHRIPTVVVAASKLGAINHTLLTLEALRTRRVPVLGVILSGHSYAGCARAIEHFGHVPVLDHLPWLDFVDHGTLLNHVPSQAVLDL